jgi:argininosuccinate synthase
MMLDPLERAGAESYPTFWDVGCRAPSASIDPPEDAYMMTKSPLAAPKPRYVEIVFEKGVPVALDGKKMPLKAIIETLNKTAGQYGIGRTDMVENRLEGIKSREIYEAPGATVILAAHRELECVVLDRETQHFKEMVSQRYSELCYYGLWYTELKKALDAFIDSTQKHVTGSIRMQLLPGQCKVAGRQSPYSLYKMELATYGKEDTFDQKLSEGFIRLWGMPYKR